MIPRYTRPQMATIWDPQMRYRIWFEIEAHAADAMAELGVIPKEAAQAIWKRGKNAEFDVARIDAIEREVKHDVIAFLTHLAEIIGPEARFLHQGMTSSDVLDTCLNVQLVRAAELLIADVNALLAALKRRAFEHKLTPTIGRSHGVHAEPTTFGLKLAYAYAEFVRAKERLICARTEVATCAISGAVGTFAQVDPRDIERRVFALGPDRLRRTFRDQAELGHGVGRMGFDLEPDAKPRLRRPDFGHRGPAIARNHAVTRSEEYEFP